MDNGKIYIYGFLTVIIFLLVAIYFKTDIQSYLKNRENLKKNQVRTQEVLGRAKLINSPEIIRDCFDWLSDESSNSVQNKKCEDTWSIYSVKEQRWQNLIKENKDINCSDFAKKSEAQEFFEYVSGEYAKGYRAYRYIVKNDPSKALEDDGSGDLVFSSNTAFDGHCRYDPYGLDTNQDCNACENLK
ncbi:hypothetical protein C4544_05725 [candidate division WS5 bacterium]|uniref:Uncharacterized protein n=1 Tax=candidate division WS5 bacterium TaxID=2093353 RepID=A0A419DB07_9BACT|nr:MAG: hypothetical protein C4544_05725 [candidate division WS5 bacterium]